MSEPSKELNDAAVSLLLMASLHNLDNVYANLGPVDSERVADVLRQFAQQATYVAFYLEHRAFNNSTHEQASERGVVRRRMVRRAMGYVNP